NVNCTGTDDCSVTCSAYDNCILLCQAEASCLLRCEGDAVCELQCNGEKRQCADGVITCNRECPEPGTGGSGGA
ncbi:MAG TPA: hypothetical protein VFB62_09365, partial [Polyangiaceae bacterium]|nr:hypothetical protein [Polyangiaceae bacterium]